MAGGKRYVVRDAARSAALALALALLVAPAFLPATGPAGAATSSSHQISWLAAGDSYSSDIGLAHTTKTCGRAIAPSEAWATRAASILRGNKVDVATPDLVACSGAVSGEFFTSFGGGQPAEFHKGSKRSDLVTFTFGGDDVGFTSIAESCYDRTGNCSDTKVRKDIATVGKGYPSFLTAVANSAVVKGGNVLVMGYPEIFEDPSLWPARDKVLHACQGMILNDVKLIRGWDGALNQAIGNAVAVANRVPAAKRNGVTFSFVDPVSGGGSIGTNDSNLFEPASGARHELCSQGPSWLNGIDWAHPLSRSLHPTQEGEDAMGALAAEVIPHMTWPWSPPVWRALGQTPAPIGPPGFSALSCAAGPSCVVIYQNEAFVWQGSGWTKVADPPGPGLGDLSCTSSSFCMGVYSTTTVESGAGTTSAIDLYVSYATSWNGHAWSQPTELDHFSTADSGYGVVHDVSCTSTSFCMAIGGDFGSAIWNGSSWRTVSGATAGTDGGTALSCTSSSFCMAAPANPNTITWNGKQWGPGTQSVPASTDWFGDVSCASATLCLATGTSANGDPYVFNGTSWSAGPSSNSQNGGPLSCANLAYCVYVPSNGTVSEYDGSAWSPAQALVANPDYDEGTLVSCAPTFCMATYSNQAFVFSVTGPGLTLSPGTGSAPAPDSAAPSTASPSTPSGPLLGAVWCGDSCVGYGTAEPTQVFNGGDPTGDVSDITWTGWGTAHATGSGTSTYVPPGEDVASGYPAPATIVAFDLGTCGNGPAYTAVEWYFPQYGQTFDPGSYIGACNGNYVGGGLGGTGNTGTAPPPTSNGNTGTTGDGNPSGSNTGATGNTG
jgi:hypothetical protein